MPQTGPELLPTAEVARRLGVHVRSVHRMVDRNELAPAMRVPGYRGPLLFEPAEVDRAKREREPAA